MRRLPHQHAQPIGIFRCPLLLRPGQEWRSALLIEHVIATSVRINYARRQRRDLSADAGRRRIDHQFERLLIN